MASAALLPPLGSPLIGEQLHPALVGSSARAVHLCPDALIDVVPAVGEQLPLLCAQIEESR